MIERNDPDRAQSNAKQFVAEWESAKPYDWATLIQDIGQALPPGFEARLGKSAEYEAFYFRHIPCGGLLVTSAFSQREIIETINGHIGICPAITKSDTLGSSVSS